MREAFRGGAPLGVSWGRVGNQGVTIGNSSVGGSVKFVQQRLCFAGRNAEPQEISGEARRQLDRNRESDHDESLGWLRASPSKQRTRAVATLESE